jgi:MFS family permease
VATHTILGRRHFVTSCISLATAAVSFAVRGDVAGPMGAAFHLTNEQVGIVLSPAFYGFALAILAGGLVIDAVGMRLLHALSALAFIVGVGLIIAAPYPDGAVTSVFAYGGTTMLYIGFFLFGIGHGLVECVINPLLASIYPREKTKRITAVHAWWPGGMILGGLATLALSTMAMSWQVRMCLILLPAIAYFLLALSLSYPPTERVTSNVPAAAMWREAARPLFILLFVCMWMTAAVELGTDQWFPVVMGGLVPSLSPDAGSGVGFLVYTAGLMFVLRVWGGSVTHKSPLGTLIVSAVLCAIGLYWLGALTTSDGALLAITAATVFGVGKTFFWPTMVGVTAELFPRGGALLMSLIGAAGMTSVAVVTPIMGARMDAYGPGAALQMMAGLGVILTVIFTGVWVYFRARGGYRAVHISTVPAE